MEIWEKDYKEKLEKGLPNKIYDLSSSEVLLLTDKLDYIDFLLAMRKKIKDYNIIIKDESATR